VATAGGTLVLAVATFSSIRSANRSARVAERSLLAGQRPVLIPSREDDPLELVRFGDGVVLSVPGHGGCLEVRDGRIYMALSLRNGGAGLAVIHGWHVRAGGATAGMPAPELEVFRTQLRDLYIPAGQTGFWQGAIRDPSDPDHAALLRAAQTGDRVGVALLYGDYEGGQRTIVGFGMTAGAKPDGEDPQAGRADVLRYWNVDGQDPR
jgi:hypothetical protein